MVGRGLLSDTSAEQSGCFSMQGVKGACPHSGEEHQAGGKCKELRWADV